MGDQRTRQQAIDSPLPLDKWGKGDREILLHMVENDTVYFGEIQDGRSYFPGGYRMPVSRFREQVDVEGVEYLGGQQNAKP